jgi:transcriptional regulator NrdR family protein
MLLAVQLKQLKQTTLLNNSIASIIDKLTTQAERDVRSLQMTEEMMQKVDKYDAHVAELVKEVDEFKETTAQQK